MSAEHSRPRPSDGMIINSARYCCKCSRRCKWMICVTVMVPLLVLVVLASVVSLRALTTSHTPTGLLMDRLTSTKGIQPKGQMERARRLAGAIRIQTISYDIGKQELQSILELHDYLKQNFPLVHGSEFVQLEVVNTYSLLYTVTGSDNRGKLPYLLASHMDVVPAANPSKWEVDPFGGVIVNNTYIYGRGAIDNKNGVLAILEALEYMISQGEQPTRTFFLAFGHDEEIMGYDGAQEIAEVLQRRGVNQLDFVYDEGTPILQGVFPGISKPLATIGVTEKGYVTVELSVTQPPGHSSFPPRHSAIGILSAAITRLELNPQPLMFGTGPEAAMFKAITPEMSFSYRVIFANLWLFSKLVASMMERDPKLNAIVRTTTAITIINGGEKENIIPGYARAVVNHRVHPSQTVEDVVQFDKKIIDDPRVAIKVISSKEAHKISPFGSEDIPYQLMAATLHQTFSEILVAPGMLIANTDTKWYLNYTDNVFRFFPLILSKEDLPRYHGDNERISVEGYQTAVDFFYRLISNADTL